MLLRSRFISFAFAGRMICIGIACALASPPAYPLSTRLVDSGFDTPLFLTAPDGDPRLFVAERKGVIKVFSNGVWSNFLDISASVDANPSTERGLLGLAFDPNYAKPNMPGFGTFYVDYVDNRLHENNTHIDKFTVSSTNPNIANPKGTSVLTVPQSNPPTEPDNFGNHKAGWIGFRPGESNNLYIATGDGGAGNDPFDHGQRTDTLLGKILRIDVHSTANGQYGIPSGNPFASSGGLPQIWDIGLRNPYRNSFDRNTGDFYIADVGQERQEEVDFEKAGHAGGVNYGWRLREGSIETPGVGGPLAGAQDPAYEYAHNGAHMAITGGYVYRGSFLSGIEGQYFFADFVTGKVWSIKIDPATGKPITLIDPKTGQPVTAIDRTAELNPLELKSSIVSFGEDSTGNLYILRSNGELLQIVPEPSTYALIGVGLVPLLWLARRRTAGPAKRA